MSARVLSVLIAALIGFAPNAVAQNALAQQRAVAKPVIAKPQAIAPAPAPKAEEPATSGDGAPPPYEPQLMRLAEILGALAFLRDLCGASDGETYRARMSALLEAETRNDARRDRLAGAFNRGFRGYQTTYLRCTPNADVIITRFLTEGGKLAREISYRYGSS